MLNFLSFLISLLVYLAFLLLIILGLGSVELNIKNYTDKNNSITIFDISYQENYEKPKNLNKEIIEKTNSFKDIKSEKENIKQKNKNQKNTKTEKDSESLSDLFDNKLSKKIQNLANKEKKQQLLKEKEHIESVKKIINNLQIQKPLPNLLSKKGGTFDPVRSSIENLIKNKWIKYKAYTDSNATINIIIDNKGKLIKHKILQFSINEAFNQKVKDFLILLEKENFSFHIDNYVNLNVVLEDKRGI